MAMRGVLDAVVKLGLAENGKLAPYRAAHLIIALMLSHSRRRTLSIRQRLSYINAVKCLNTLPSANPSHGTVSRYDDFIWAHVEMTPVIHFVVSANFELQSYLFNSIISRVNSTHGIGTLLHFTITRCERSADTVDQRRTLHTPEEQLDVQNSDRYKSPCRYWDWSIEGDYISS